MTIAPTPRLAGRYTLLEQIAYSALAEEWLAHDEVLGREVAVKVMAPNVGGDPRALARFRQESGRAAKLSHPGIAGVYDYGEQAGRAFLVIELVGGEPLSELLRREGPLQPARALDLVGQVAQALQGAHDQGVVHGDVQADNIIVRADGVAKVTDFGLARALEAAPGRGQGAAPVDPAGDVYALGLLAYECLIGSRAFEAATAVSTALAQCHQPPPELAGELPHPIRELVEQALAEHVADRIGTAGEFARRALALSARYPELAAQPARTPTIPATRPLPAASRPRPTGTRAEPSQRHVRWVLIGVATVVVLLGFLGLRACATQARAPVARRTVSPSARLVPGLADRYLGQPFATVNTALQKLGFRVAQQSSVTGAEPTGTVLSVTPAGYAPAGGTATVTVATAPIPPPSGSRGHGGQRHGD